MEDKYFLITSGKIKGKTFKNQIPVDSGEPYIEITKEQYEELTRLSAELIIQEIEYTNKTLITRLLTDGKHVKQMKAIVNNICMKHDEIVAKNTL